MVKTKCTNCNYFYGVDYSLGLRVKNVRSRPDFIKEFLGDCFGCCNLITRHNY